MPIEAHSTNEEIAINYPHTGILLDRQLTIPDEHFALMVSEHMSDDIPDPISILECQS